MSKITQKPPVNETDATTGLFAQFKRGFKHQFKRQIAGALAIGFSVGLLSGGIFGFGVVLSQEKFSLTALAVCLVCLVVGGFTIWRAYRKFPSLRDGDPDTPRARRIGKLSFVTLAITIAIVLPFAVTGDTFEGGAFLSNDPVPAWVAYYLGAMWIFAMPPMMYLFRQNMDEIEKAEMQFGEMIGFQFFAITAPAWWIASRGGLAPEPDIMILFAITLAVALLANLYRKLA